MERRLRWCGHVSAVTLVGTEILLGIGGAWLAGSGGKSAIAAPPSTVAYTFPIRRQRWPDLMQGFRQGTQAFLQEVQRGGFIALTGVEPRQPIRLLEGASYSLAADNSITFTLSDGTVVPPISRAGYDALVATVPPHQRAVLDDKFFWHLQRNPAIPLIAAGLGQGKYQELVSQQRFDTDTYYLKSLFGYLFWLAQTANVSLEELMPLVETHLLTLEHAYFRDGHVDNPSGAVYSFYKFEQELTNKQYLMRSLLTTPLESLARLEAINRVEGENIKKDYTNTEFTSTTISMGRLPLPTPTAAEDAVAVHALNIAHLVNEGIDFFPDGVETAALIYQQLYRQRLATEMALKGELQTFAEQHGMTILRAIDNYYDMEFWAATGLTETLNRRSVNQMDTSRLLGIYATRTEGLNRATAAESYPVARQHFITFFQKNSPGLAETELLTLLFCDQVFNPRFWRALKRQHPDLLLELNAIQKSIAQLEKDYADTIAQEAEVFRLLQRHDLDITTEAFSLLSVAMAKRLSDLVYLEFQPGDRKHPDYLEFTRVIYPFIRDMPDLNMQWGNGLNIKRYGLDNYVVPDLMALTPEDSPTLSAWGDLWHKMVSNSDLNRWDSATFIKVINTAFNLSSNRPPSTLPAEQVALLPLVDKYRPELKRIAGADGANAPTVLHGLTRQDFRIDTWPRDRPAGKPRIVRIESNSLQSVFPDLSAADIDNLIWRLSNHSGEFSLALPLILLNDPLFLQRDDGAVDLLFEWNGEQRVFPAISRHFESVYSPLYITRIALPAEPDQSYVNALNEVVRRTHALYGGYTPRDLNLPQPLQTLPGE